VNILLLAPHPFYAPRGTPIAVRAVLESLSELGHSVDVLSFHEGVDVTDIPRVVHHRIEAPPAVSHVPIGVSWQKAVSDVFLFFRANQMIRRAKRRGSPYDMVHAVEESAFMAGVFRRWYGLPFVFDMDSLMSAQIVEKSVWLKPAAKVFEVLERRSIRASAGVLAVCPALVDEAMKYHPAGNVALLPDIPNTGMQEGELPEAMIQAPGPPEGVRLMYVGNLEAYQGVGLMLDAFKHTAAVCASATLVVVGGRRDHIEQYTTQARDLVVSGRVRFVGAVPIERLGRVMQHADVLVSPRTKGTNTPMKIYSYLQSGKAVLATRLVTHTQVMNDQVAMLVEPQAKAMGDAMTALVQDASKRETLGAAGKAYVQAEFSRDAYHARLGRFYEPFKQWGKGTSCGAPVAASHLSSRETT